jgi:hypothetical protein
LSLSSSQNRRDWACPVLKTGEIDPEQFAKVAGSVPPLADIKIGEIANDRFSKAFGAA